MVFRIFALEIFFRIAMSRVCAGNLATSILPSFLPFFNFTNALTSPLIPLPSRCGSGEGIFSCGSCLSRLSYSEMNPVPSVNIEAELPVIGYGNSLRRAAATGLRIDSFQSKASLTA